MPQDAGSEPSIVHAAPMCVVVPSSLQTPSAGSTVMWGPLQGGLLPESWAAGLPPEEGEPHATAPARLHRPIVFQSIPGTSDSPFGGIDETRHSGAAQGPSAATMSGGRGSSDQGASTARLLSQSPRSRAARATRIAASLA